MNLNIKRNISSCFPFNC